MRILVVARSYPATGNLYQYPFVHRRVLAYLRAGHDVVVFRPGQSQSATAEFDSVTCHSGGAAALARLAGSWPPDVIAAHGLSEQMWPLLAPLAGVIPIRAWLHGSEIPAFFRAKINCIADATEQSSAQAALDARCAFWDAFLKRQPERFGLVFVSRAALAMAREDWGGIVERSNVAVIPNPIDTDLFRYTPKTAQDRWSILTLRPFDSPTYGNDMAVEVIRRVAIKTGARARFTVIGDGPLFDETVAPLTGVEGVRLERRFVTQTEIADEHRRHGIFLVPTRLDTQGVSRDEAMSSGMVPVTNAIPAVEEFADAACAALAAPEDVDGLTAALVDMLDDPQLFVERSAAAAQRVRRQSGQDIVIPAELELLEESAVG